MKDRLKLKVITYLNFLEIGFICDNFRFKVYN